MNLFNKLKMLIVKINKKIGKEICKYRYVKDISQFINGINSQNKKVILFFNVVDWQIPLFQRPQHIARCLAEQNYTYIYFTGNVYDNVRAYEKKAPNLYIVNTVFSKKIFKELKVNKKYIQLYSTDMKTTNSRIDEYIQQGYEVFYEYIDEISPELYGNDIPKLALEKHNRILKDTKIKVVCTARKLYQEVEQVRGKENVVLVTNGVQYEHFTQDIDKKDCPISEIVNKKKPIIGYFGAFANWFDYELVEELAKQRPQYEILLMGWKYDDSYEKSKLKNYTNITAIGPIAYDELPRYATYFSTSIIPFKLNEITESTSPIKLFEYMALGKPIVTTDMPECRLYESVLIGKTMNDFIKQIDSALQLNNDYAYLQILNKEALENTWEAKAKDIDKLLTNEE